MKYTEKQYTYHVSRLCPTNGNNPVLYCNSLISAGHTPNMKHKIDHFTFGCLNLKLFP